jgi:phosphoesterase RecJ-like protein
MRRQGERLTIHQIGRKLADSRHVLITSHDKPDGDSIGSTLALARLIDRPGKRIDVVHAGPTDPSLLLLAPPTMVLRAEMGIPHGEPDCIAVLDTASWSQLETMQKYLKAHNSRIVVIDHHSHGDDVGVLRMIDPTAAATAVLVMDLADEMKWKITPGNGGVAEALYAGLASDTGWFRFANADARAFAAASRLLTIGVDKTRLHEIIEENHRPARLAVMARALGSIQYFRDGAVALMSLAMRDFQETGGRPEDLTSIINLPMTVGAVRVSALLTQHEAGKTKVSFRSKPRREGALFVDVNQLAQKLGGGGHVHAAGARLAMDLDQAREKVIELLEREGGS